MRALVTNATDESGVVAARSLRAAGFEVQGCDLRRVGRLTRSRYLSSYHCLGGRDDPFLDLSLLRLVDRERPDVFLPCGTRATVIASKHRDALASMTALNVVGADTFLRAFDKAACKETCRSLGIPCADVLAFDDARSLLERERGRTLVVKPRWDVGAATGVSYVRDAAALDEAVASCERSYGGCIIEDFVAGGADAMKTVVLLFAGDGALAAAFTMRKVRQWPPSGGPTAVSRSTMEPELVELVLPFFRALRWRGPAEVELKLDDRDGCHKVIEVNPRFPGYARFPPHCGLDLPLLAVRSALGEAAPAALPRYRAGETYLAPTLFARTVRAEARQLGAAAALRRARKDARGAAAIVAGMLADPMPPLVRALAPSAAAGPGVTWTLSMLRGGPASPSASTSLGGA